MRNDGMSYGGSIGRLAATAVLVAVLSVALLGVAPVGAVVGDDPGLEIDVSATTIQAGSPVTVTGLCRPGGVAAETAVVEIYFIRGQGGGPYSEVVGPRVEADGSWSVTFVLPADAQNGRYNASMGCFISDMGYGGASVQFTVVGGVAPAVPASTTTTAAPSTTAVVTSSTLDARPHPSSPRRHPGPTQAPAPAPATPVRAAPGFTG